MDDYFLSQSNENIFDINTISNNKVLNYGNGFMWSDFTFEEKDTINILDYIEKMKKKKKEGKKDL